MNKWVLMSLISGLNEEDTKQAVLSKVKEMTLDETVAFRPGRKKSQVLWEKGSQEEY